jgi:hypothetical protein
LPSSLTRFHSRAISIFYSPTCVGLRYGRPWQRLGVFLAPGLKNPVQPKPPCRLAARALSIARSSLLTRLPRIIHSRCRNIKPASSIAYALRPRLRSRLTLGGRTFPRKPWVYGGRGFHPSYRYSCLHSHLSELHRPFPDDFKALTMLPYQAYGSKSILFQSFGRALIANHFRRGNTR